MTLTWEIAVMQKIQKHKTNKIRFSIHKNRKQRQKLLQQRVAAVRPQKETSYVSSSAMTTKSFIWPTLMFHVPNAGKLNIGENSRDSETFPIHWKREK